VRCSNVREVEVLQVLAESERRIHEPDRAASAGQTKPKPQPRRKYGGPTHWPGSYYFLIVRPHIERF
jgi:hypothetical protein